MVFAILSRKKRKGIIDTNLANATFWYRRTTEIALVLSIAIGTIWLGAALFPDQTLLETLVVSPFSATLAACTLIVALITLSGRVQQYAKWLATGLCILLAATILLSINDTGNMSSPYIPLWALVALFSPVASIIASFLPIALGSVGYAFYLLFYAVLEPAQWVTFGLVIILPLLIGLFIRIRQSQEQDTSNLAVTELASELSQESSKSSIILDAIADGVLLISTDGIVQLMNPAAERIIGWGNEDAAKLDYRSVLKIVDESDAIIDSSLDPIKQCLITNESVITDSYGIRTISGKRLLVSIMVSPLSQANSGVIVVFRDITAQRAEERDQAEFISTASHEMRTPVATIEGYLGLALNPQTATIDDKARMYITKAQESAGNLGRLFQDLLDISKVEDGRLKSKLVVIDVISVVRPMLDDFAGQIKEKSLSLVFGPDFQSSGGQSITPLFYASADLGHLQEIMTNLIGNAIKYTKAGNVTVDVTGDDDHVFISVTDSGIGIPAEDIPHLFQKFYRVDNSDTREIGGTGLGLYLARRLTESMRGHLTVTSTYGTGSTFTVELPRISKEDAVAQLNAQNTQPAPVTVPDQTKL